MKEFFAVSLPVADLREKPVDPAGRYVHDELQGTQVLYNEELVCLECFGDWCKVEAIEQKKISCENICHGYPGWIRKGSIRKRIDQEGFNSVVKDVITEVYSEPYEKGEPLFYVLLGTRFFIKDEYKGFVQVLLVEGKDGWIKKKALRIINDDKERYEIRKGIVETAELFLGTPYLWGGRSIFTPFDKNTGGILRGVDCSGLTNLVYRVNNIDIPRNAHDQWLISEEIGYESLAPGDMIFLSSRGDDRRINHVMLYTGNGQFIEALETGSFVRKSNFIEKFGMPLDKIAKMKFFLENRRLYLRSYFKKNGAKS